VYTSSILVVASNNDFNNLFEYGADFCCQFGVNIVGTFWKAASTPGVGWRNRFGPWTSIG
jgi:hypothetical protein